MISCNLLPFILNTINNALGQHSAIKNKLFKLFTFSLWFSVQSLFVINESRVNFWRFFAKTTTHIVVQDTKPFRAKSENWRIKMGRIGINSLLPIKFKILDCKKHGIYRLFVMYFGSCSLASYCLDRLENPLLTDLKAERCRLCASLPHCHCLKMKCQNCFSSLFNALAELTSLLWPAEWK